MWDIVYMHTNVHMLRECAHAYVSARVFMCLKVCVQAHNMCILYVYRGVVLCVHMHGYRCICILMCVYMYMCVKCVLIIGCVWWGLAYSCVDVYM